MADLTNGFFERVFDGENLDSVTPLFRVATPYTNGKMEFDDGSTVQKCYIVNRFHFDKKKYRIYFIEWKKLLKN